MFCNTFTKKNFFLPCTSHKNSHGKKETTTYFFIFWWHKFYCTLFSRKKLLHQSNKYSNSSDNVISHNVSKKQKDFWDIIKICIFIYTHINNKKYWKKISNEHAPKEFFFKKQTNTKVKYYYWKILSQIFEP